MQNVSKNVRDGINVDLADATIVKLDAHSKNSLLTKIEHIGIVAIPPTSQELLTKNVSTRKW